MYCTLCKSSFLKVSSSIGTCPLRYMPFLSVMSSSLCKVIRMLTVNDVLDAGDEGSHLFSVAFDLEFAVQLPLLAAEEEGEVDPRELPSDHGPHLLKEVVGPLGEEYEVCDHDHRKEEELGLWGHSDYILP